MTRQQIKIRRTIRAMGRKKFVIIQKTKTKHDLVFFIPPICWFPFWNRIKSLFNFKKFNIPEYFSFKGHKCQVSKYRLQAFN